jgi:membrane-associated phospholipid phosphatase
MRFLKSTVVLVLVYIVSSISLLIITLPTVVKAFRSSSSPSSSSSSSLLTHHNIAQSRLLLRPSTTTPSMKTCRTSVNMESKKSSSSSSSISTAQKQNEDNNNNGNNKNNNNVNRIWTTVYTKIGSTTSICVAFAFFITLCWKRDALMVSFFLGSILNAIFGKILKRILKHDRPTTTTAIIPINGEVIKEEEVKEDSSMMMMKMKAAVQQQPARPSDNGMPSSHAMSLGFICTFVALLIPNMILPLLTYAVISLIYRVRVSLHSIDQIIVGSILGIFDGSIWWYLCGKSTGSTNIVDLISSSGIMNEHGQLPWYLLVVPALIGVAVVGSVERRLGMYFQRSKSSTSNKSSSGSGIVIVSTISDENINKLD